MVLQEVAPAAVHPDMEQGEPESNAQQTVHMLLRMHIIIVISMLRTIVIELGSFPVFRGYYRGMKETCQ